MGVKGLWRLLLPIGRRISLETLAGRVLAVDASIWLTQLVKALRDPATGKVVVAAHLVGFFRRLCRLRYHGIRPVLVFDGAPPEIKRREVVLRRKRREQFAKLTDGSVQRLAKKLLAETLQRNNNKKSSSGGGAFVAGFVNPHASDKKGDPETGDTAPQPPSLSSRDEMDSETQQQPPILNESVEDLIATTTTTTTTTTKATNQKTNQQVSDWDLPLQVAAAEEAKEREQQQRFSKDDTNDDDLSLSDEEIEYETLNDFTGSDNKNKSKDVIFSVDHVASLPAIQRKDAVEEAKKRQRLQSRREFMPAAAHPLQFSQTQLKNFLKSCQLNRDIHTMAQKAAVHDNQGLPGEFMASDRTTRVELIREPSPPQENDNPDSTKDDEEDGGDPDSDTASNGPRSLLKAKVAEKRTTVQPRRKHRLMRHSNQTDSDSDDHDDGRNWGNVNDQQDETEPSTQRPRLRAIHDNIFGDDDDDDDDEPKEEVAVGAPIGRGSKRDPVSMDDPDDPGGGFLPKPKHQRLDDDDDDGGGGGGFLPAGRRLAESEAKSRVQVPSTDAVIAIHTSSDDASFRDGDDQDTDSGAGGFLPAKRFACKVLLPPPPATTTTAVPSLDNVSTSTATALEAQDQALARALQEEEDAAAARTVTACGTLSADDFETRHFEDQNVEQALEQSRRHLNEAMQHPGALELARNFSATAAGQSSKHLENLGDEDEDEDVNWEDGASGGSNTEKPGSDLGQSQSEKSISDDDNEVKVWNKLHADNCESIEWEDEHLTSTASDFDVSSDRLKAQASGSALSPETSAALLHAQSTAANLTNWAGRAFRRAMAEAGASTEPTTETYDGTPVASQAAGPVHINDADKEILAEKTTVAVKRSAQSASSPLSHSAGETEVAKISDATTAARSRYFPEPFDAFDPALIEANQVEWTAERNRRERDMDTVTDEMLQEAKQLLQLFGIPYVEAPAEAEAQCVALEELGLVDGIVTEDSDVFVFGGKTVYRNIFDEQKYAEVYTADDAEREMNLGRNGMVALAMLLGGDYSAGVKGVGIVNAMEILETFDVSEDLKAGLMGFKKWLDGFDPAVDALNVKDAEHLPQTKEQKFHAKHKTARTRWIADNFPSEAVLHAYLNPVVDKSEERFSWGTPDVENLVIFCNRHMGWSPDDTKRLLEPVLRQQSGMRQTRIDSFMRYEDKIKFADVRSKRLREVLGIKQNGDKTKDDRDEDT